MADAKDIKAMFGAELEQRRVQLRNAADKLKDKLQKLNSDIDDVENEQRFRSWAASYIRNPTHHLSFAILLVTEEFNRYLQGLDQTPLTVGDRWLVRKVNEDGTAAIVKERPNSLEDEVALTVPWDMACRMKAAYKVRYE